MAVRDMSYTQNREISWLRFNQRVMHEAIDESVPDFEKLQFISIFGSNLDEFFMVRVGSLTDLSLLKSTLIDNKTGQTPQEQLDEVFAFLPPLYAERDRIFNRVQKKLENYNIYYQDLDTMKKGQRKYLQDYYNNFILPILSPQIVDYHHPFPFLANKDTYIVQELVMDNNKFLGIIPVPKAIPYLMSFPNYDENSDDVVYTLSPKIILKYASRIFTGYTVKNEAIIRVTRNADLNADEEIADTDEDYRSHMKKILKKRTRLQAVRLETNQKLSPFLQEELLKNLDIKEKQIMISKSPFDMSYLSNLEKLIPNNVLKKITNEKFSPQKVSSIDYNKPIMPQIEKNTKLLKFPYEEIDPFIQMISEAAEDPEVVSIKITIYRLAKNSKLVQNLIKAAENGKEVVALMELRARFDEQANIDYTDILYEAGCNIIYGFPEYKVHSKICLITKQTKNGIKYITQVGTGNYNESTAAHYTDISMITSNDEIGQDASNFFKNMATGNLMGTYNHLLAAPASLKPVFISLIDEEIAKGPQGNIFCKMNSLTDRDIIDKFQEASMAGVRVRLIIRGISCLVPGIPGKTENIEIRSIVGRFLEHARIFCFGNGMSSKVFMSSADFMTRNTERRVEIACPIFTKEIKEELLDYLETQFMDNFKARVMDSNGEYQGVPANPEEEKFVAQEYFMQEAIKKASQKLEEKEEKSFISKFFGRIFTRS